MNPEEIENNIDYTEKEKLYIKLKQKVLSEIDNLQNQETNNEDEKNTWLKLFEQLVTYYNAEGERLTIIGRSPVAFVVVRNLFNAPKTPNLQKFISDMLSLLTDSEVEFYLPQLANFSLAQPQPNDPVGEFLINRCKFSLKIALQLFFILQSYVQDNDPLYVKKAKQLWKLCENAATSNEVAYLSDDVNSPNDQFFHVQEKLQQVESLLKEQENAKKNSNVAKKKYVVVPPKQNDSKKIKPKETTESNDLTLSWALSASSLRSYFLGKLSTEYAEDVNLSNEDDKENQHLSSFIKDDYNKNQEKDQIENNQLPLVSKQVYEQYSYQYFYSELALISILTDISTLLKTLETWWTDIKELRNQALKLLLKQLNEQFLTTNNIKFLPGSNGDTILNIPFQEAFCLNSRDRVPFMITIELKKLNETQNPDQSSEEIILNKNVNSVNLEDLESQTDEWIVLEDEETQNNSPFGDLWKVKKQKIAETSPFFKELNEKKTSHWDLHSCIIKGGDDLREERLAMQMIKVCQEIFDENKLPLYLRPYYIIATSNNSGIVETITDTISLDGLKKKIKNFTSLKNYFIEQYGIPTSRGFSIAQTNFVESLAAYSLVCYLLQIKDRHNGNILLDAKGHIIHIDYGYWLYSSPGLNMNFESAPFKLSSDFIELIGDENSNMFKYFETVFVSGFLALRKNYNRIIGLANMMLPTCNFKCFGKNAAGIDAFQHRLFLKASEDEVIQSVLNLITASNNNWRNITYDTFQYYSNNIL